MCYVNYFSAAQVLKGGMSKDAAEIKIRGTFSADKNELLYKDYGT